MKKTNKNSNKTNLNSNFQFLTSDHRGITLIALVITIIVMLILVAVTINIAVNGGLFGYAGNASAQTKTARDEEQNYTNVESGLTTEQLIEKFTTTPDIHSWTREGDTFTCSHCNASYTMGDVVNYTPNTGKTQTTVYGTDSGYLASLMPKNRIASTKITKKIMLAAEFSEVGSASGGTQTTPTLQDQTISRESLTWIVLGLDKNGTLLITTSTPTTGKINLRGALSYVNGPSIMNTVCEELYSNSTYGKARSINIDDVNLALNWTDTRGMVYPVSDDPFSAVPSYKVNAGTKFGDVGTGKMAQADWDAIKNNNQTPETGKALTDYEINGYSYGVSEVANINNLRKQIIFGEEIQGGKGVTYSYSYCLASRGVYANSSGGFARFGPAYVFRGSVNAFSEMFYSNGGENDYGFGLRPVVPLKSELPAKANS